MIILTVENVERSVLIFQDCIKTRAALQSEFSSSNFPKAVSRLKRQGTRNSKNKAEKYLQKSSRYDRMGKTREQYAKLNQGDNVV